MAIYLLCRNESNPKMNSGQVSPSVPHVIGFLGLFFVANLQNFMSA